MQNLIATLEKGGTKLEDVVRYTTSRYYKKYRIDRSQAKLVSGYTGDMVSRFARGDA